MHKMIKKYSIQKGYINLLNLVFPVNDVVDKSMIKSTRLIFLIIKIFNA